jgi:hypothetical protein
VRNVKHPLIPNRHFKHILSIASTEGRAPAGYRTSNGKRHVILYVEILNEKNRIDLKQLATVTLQNRTGFANLYVLTSPTGKICIVSLYIA